jgi:hypothetical protein
MREVKPLKIEFIDKDTMTKVEDLWNIIVTLDPETSEIIGWYINNDPELDKKLEIRIV